MQARGHALKGKVHFARKQINIKLFFLLLLLVTFSFSCMLYLHTQKKILKPTSELKKIFFLNSATIKKTINTITKITKKPTN